MHIIKLYKIIEYLNHARFPGVEYLIIRTKYMNS